MNDNKEELYLSNEELLILTLKKEQKDHINTKNSLLNTKKQLLICMRKNIELQIELLQQENNNIISQSNTIKKELLDLLKELSSKYELDDNWRYDQETGLIINNE